MVFTNYQAISVFLPENTIKIMAFYCRHVHSYRYGCDWPVNALPNLKARLFIELQFFSFSGDFVAMQEAFKVSTGTGRVHGVRSSQHRANSKALTCGIQFNDIVQATLHYTGRWFEPNDIMSINCTPYGLLQ
jgi:hypothetical protein